MQYKSYNEITANHDIARFPQHTWRDEKSPRTNLFRYHNREAQGAALSGQFMLHHQGVTA
jgi:hypothetical protein